MNRTPRVDAHQHFWRLADRQGHWPPPALAAIHRDFTPADFEPLRDRAGIDATVLVQSMPSEQETRELLRIAHEHAFVHGVVGWVDMKAADAPQRIDALAADPLLKGLRPMLQDLPADDWIADSAVDPASRAMQRHHLVFEALVMPRHLAALEAFASRHGELQVVIDHGAKPSIATGEIDAWRAAMARLAGLPHVACKMSGLLTEARPRGTVEDLLPYVQTLWELFGPQRLVWGSDWPVLRLVDDYQAWLDMSVALLDAVAPSATATERAAVLGGNAVRLYRLDTPGVRTHGSHPASIPC
ncbi:amidohydrolase family protein [Piscinibacter sp.]|uniref:amidohydrolase family protein n=1 Tax=Piscinibacter sp. TaxID=1903157 RepID=UPI002C52E942|nr:amidohydrolase family protein [Albitalea sp.]HUG25569.1 amidohydrolase family protein [Albitalea sp.]